jgi:hypothetical protein
MTFERFSRREASMTAQAAFTFSTNDASNAARVLALLRDGAWRSTLELQAVGGTRAQLVDRFTNRH